MVGDELLTMIRLADKALVDDCPFRIAIVVNHQNTSETFDQVLFILVLHVLHYSIAYASATDVRVRRSLTRSVGFRSECRASRIATEQ